MDISEFDKIIKNLLYESKSLVGVGFPPPSLTRSTSQYEERTRHVRTANIKVTIRAVQQEQQEMLALPDKAARQPHLYSEISEIQSKLFDR